MVSRQQLLRHFVGNPRSFTCENYKRICFHRNATKWRRKNDNNVNICNILFLKCFLYFQSLLKFYDKIIQAILRHVNFNGKRTNVAMLILHSLFVCLCYDGERKVGYNQLVFVKCNHEWNNTDRLKDG